METLGTALTKTMPSVEDFEECARLMDEFDRSVERQLIFNIPSENGKLKIQPVNKMYESAMETEPMTTTTETVITKTERTAEDIIEAVGKGEYFLSTNNNIQVYSNWDGSLTTSWKPHSFEARESEPMRLGKGELEELLLLNSLLEADAVAKSNKCDTNYYAAKINTLSKGK